MAREPHADWRSDRLSQGRVADYKPFVMVDGEGVRCSLYVSGCPFACEGCFNEAAWSFRYGHEFDDALADRIAADLAHPAVQGLTLLGGDIYSAEECGSWLADTGWEPRGQHPLDGPISLVLAEAV